MNLELNQQDIDDIDEALADEDLPGKFRRKLLTLKMRHAGAPLGMIAKTLKVTIRSVSNYIAEFHEGGLEATLEDRAYCPMSSVEPFMEELEKSFRESPVGSARQAFEQVNPSVLVVNANVAGRAQIVELLRDVSRWGQ